MKVLLAFISFLISISSTQADIKFIKNDFDKALDQAKKSNKLIFVDVYTDWCGPCKRMDKLVFTDGEVSDFYNDSFINLKINAEKGEGVDFAKKYNIKLYPTFLFLDQSGKIVYLSRGGKIKESFMGLGKRAFNESFHPENMAEKFDSGKNDKTFLDNCLEVFKDNLKVNENGKVLAAYYNLGYFKNEAELLNKAELYLYVIDNNLFKVINKLGLEKPEKQHYLKITLNRIVNNYIAFDNSLSSEQMNTILSATFLDEETRNDLINKSETIKNIKFGPN